MLRRVSNGFHFYGMLTCHPSLKKSILFYSNSVASKNGITSPLLAEFLVKSAGFSEAEAASIVTKVRTPIKNPELVVDFLKQSGFDGEQIRKVIARRPYVLRNKVDETLKPKIRAFENVGLCGSNLGLMISRNPDALASNVNSSIVPALAMLKSLLGGDEQLVRFMLQVNSVRLFSPQLCKNLPANVQLLQRYGLTSKSIEWLMLRCRFVFMSSQWAEELLQRVEGKLRIPRTSNMFVCGIYVSSKSSEEKFSSMLEVFRSHGWSEINITVLLRRHPLVVCLAENHVRAKLKYFMEDLGLGPDYLSKHPAMLGYSMEKRILPRVAVRQVLMDRKLLEGRIGLSGFLAASQANFMAKFVIPYKEKVPELYEKYTLATGYSTLNC